MYAAVALFFFICTGAATCADHHHDHDHHEPCHSPNTTGSLSVMSHKGDVKAVLSYNYDAATKKLRLKSNDTALNTSVTLDVLMFFEEGVFYEIDSRNHSCEKKALQSTVHPLDIPSDATFQMKMLLGSATVEEEGLKVNIWTDSVPETKATYIITTTMGCLPVSGIYITDTASLLVSIYDVETEIKDPDVLNVPHFCEDEALEDTPEGTVNCFFNLFF